MRFLDFVDQLETRQVTLRGKPLQLRALSTSQAFALSTQIRVPPEQPPAGVDATEHEVARALAIIRTRAITIAAAAGWTNTMGEQWTVHRDRAWCEAFADEIADSLTQTELIDLWVAAQNCALGVADDRDDQDRIGTESHQGN